MVRVGVGALLLLSLLVPSLGLAGPTEPGPGARFSFSLDRDGDRVDDTLERALVTPLPAPLPPTVRLVDDAPHLGVFVHFDRDVTALDVAALSRLGLVGAETFPLLLPRAAHAWASPEAIRAAAALPEVSYVEADVELRPTLGVSVPATRARASDLYPGATWETFNVTGEGAVVAVLDSGIDDEHALLTGKVVAGFDATMPPALQTGPLIPLLYETNPDDDSDVLHGTHVAGIVAGGTTADDLAGVAPDAKLLDVKVLGPAGSLTSIVVRGLEWVASYNAGQTTYGVPDVRARVATISLGGYPTDGSAPQGDDAASQAVNAAFEKGLVVVVAAGNCGPGSEAPASDCPRKGADTVSLPGVAARALTVAAVDDANSVGRSDDTVAGYSSRGPNGAEPKPNLAAPGSRIESAAGHPLPGQARSATKPLSGTSMAAPHVAGAAALLFEANPALSASQARSLLLLTAEDRGDDGWDADYGEGLLDAYAAATQALRLANDPRADAAAEIPPLTEIPGGNGTLPGGNGTLGPAVHNDLPLAKFTFTPTRGAVGKTVRFEDASFDPDGRIVERHWSFGDGSTSGETNPEHIYARTGEFLVSLRVVDDRGGDKTAQAHLTIREKLAAQKADSPGAEGLGLALAVAAAALVLGARRARGA